MHHPIHVLDASGNDAHHRNNYKQFHQRAYNPHSMGAVIIGRMALHKSSPAITFNQVITLQGIYINISYKESRTDERFCFVCFRFSGRLREEYTENEGVGRLIIDTLTPPGDTMTDAITKDRTTDCLHGQNSICKESAVINIDLITSLSSSVITVILHRHRHHFHYHHHRHHHHHHHHSHRLDHPRGHYHYYDHRHYHHHHRPSLSPSPNIINIVIIVVVVVVIIIVIIITIISIFIKRRL